MKRWLWSFAKVALALSFVLLLAIVWVRSVSKIDTEAKVFGVPEANRAARVHASRLGAVWAAICDLRGAEEYRCEVFLATMTSTGRQLDLVMQLKCDRSECFSTAPTRALGEVAP